MTLKSRFITAIATGAVLMNALAPLSFAETIDITGNGSFSTNTAAVTNTQTQVVTQTNVANVTNAVTTNANTGGNKADFNTGGDTVIKTGDATNNVNVSNELNKNIANVDCCNQDSLKVKIAGNGAYSTNNAAATNTDTKYVTQANTANVTNAVTAKADTGKNDASFNTNGDSIIVTGNAKNNVTVNTEANKNVAVIGGPVVANPRESSITIEGNGAFSSNSVALAKTSAVVLTQASTATIVNAVTAKANTGKNTSSFNTGGTTAIVTGNAKTNVDIDNKVNFNAASIDCGCLVGDLKAKIADNGSFATNRIAATLDDAVFATQTPVAYLTNAVYDKNKTGRNDASYSTGHYNGDPAVITGSSESNTSVSNAGNVNIFSEGVNLHFPGDWNVGLNFDLGALLALINLG